MRRQATTDIRGERIDLLPERAAWWARERTLLVADLHIGKEHAYAALGVGLPGGVLAETLARLGAAVALSSARRVLVLGDLLHARLGLTGEVIDLVAEWRSALPAQIDVVPGNHDGALLDVARRWDMSLLPSGHEEPPFRFVHDPGHADPDRAQPDAYTWAGHVHPGVRLAGGADALRLPCFITGPSLGVLPAFSLFTGRSLSAADLPGDRWAIADGAVLPVSPAPARR